MSLGLQKAIDDNAAIERAVDRAHKYHLGCIGGFKQQMGYAFLAGLEFANIKDCLPHGEFLKLCKKRFADVSERTIQRYMKFCEAVRQLPGSLKSATMSDLKLLPSGELSEVDKEKVSKAVYQLADGKSLTEMYRDLGIIRQPKPAGGFRPGNAEVQEWLAEKHPELKGTKFDDLPAELQKAFKKTYRPKVKPGEREALVGQRGIDMLELVGECHDAAWFNHLKCEQPVKHVERAVALFQDHLNALREWLKKAARNKK